MTQPIFNHRLTQLNQERSRQVFSDHSFLYDFAIQECLERLTLIRRTFGQTLYLSLAENVSVLQNAALQNIHPVHHIPLSEHLDLPEAHFDLILSPLYLHHLNDLPGMLAQLKRALKPDGLLMAALIGENSLQELRTSLAHAEMDLTGGMTSRLSPTISLRDMAILMQRAGFHLPVADVEHLTVTYPDIFALIKDLRGMGEGQSLHRADKPKTPRNLFARTDEIYKKEFSGSDKKIIATFDVIFTMGWSAASGK